MDLRVLLVEGRGTVPAVGSVASTALLHPPFVVHDVHGAEIAPVTGYLRQLALNDSSPLTCRSYAFGMLRWFRLLWILQVGRRAAKTARRMEDRERRLLDRGARHRRRVFTPARAQRRARSAVAR